MCYFLRCFHTQAQYKLGFDVTEQQKKSPKLQKFRQKKSHSPHEQTECSVKDDFHEGTATGAQSRKLSCSLFILVLNDFTVKPADSMDGFFYVCYLIVKLIRCIGDGPSFRMAS